MSEVTWSLFAELIAQVNSIDVDASVERAPGMVSIVVDLPHKSTNFTTWN